VVMYHHSFSQRPRIEQVNQNKIYRHLVHPIVLRRKHRTIQYQDVIAKTGVLCQAVATSLNFLEIASMTLAMTSIREISELLPEPQALTRVSGTTHRNS
jgi:hypothetical protein